MTDNLHKTGFFATRRAFHNITLIVIILATGCMMLESIQPKRSSRNLAVTRSPQSVHKSKPVQLVYSHRSRHVAQCEYPVCPYIDFPIDSIHHFNKIGKIPTTAKQPHNTHKRQIVNNSNRNRRPRRPYTPYVQYNRTSVARVSTSTPVPAIRVTTGAHK
jgi:hypothetical protein